MTNEELFDWCSKQNCKLYSNCDLCMYDKGRNDVAKEIYSNLMSEISLLTSSDMSKENLYKFALRVTEFAEQLKEQIE